MAAVSGLASGIGWTGYAGLYATPGYVAPYAFTLNVQGGTFPTTASNTSGVVVASNGATPYAWSGTITCRTPNTPASGFSGLVTWGDSKYDTNIRDWSLDITWGEKDVTAFNGTAVTSRTWIALLSKWSGTFKGFIDGTTSLTGVDTGSSTIATLTLKLLEAATDDTIAGTAIVTAMNAQVGVETGGDVDYAFEGTGQLAVNGTNWGVSTSGIFSGNAIITPAAGALTLTAATGRTYSGNAFANKLSIKCAVDTGIETVIGFRGTGDLAFA